MCGWVQVHVQQIQCFWWASWLHSPSWDRFGSSDDATNPTIILRTGNPSKSALLVPRDKFGDPPPGSGSQPLWAGIENTGQSVSHSVPTPALRVPKTHLGANLGARNLCGKILELFVFSLAWTFMLIVMLSKLVRFNISCNTSCIKYKLYGIFSWTQGEQLQRDWRAWIKYAPW